MKESKTDKQPEQVPTKSEMDVLQVLWAHGPSTVRFVHDLLNTQKEAVQYTSTLKLMQVMTEKGMLERDQSNMKHIYKPLLKEEKTKGFLLGRFLDQCIMGQSAISCSLCLTMRRLQKKNFSY